MNLKQLCMQIIDKGYDYKRVQIMAPMYHGENGIDKLNIELQEMSMKVEAQEDTNQSLAMKINEMASLENIQIISKNLGLSYNNENIKTIE